MTRILNPLRRSPTSCSVLALAAVMAFGATPAHAQFVGTIDTSAGIDTVNSTNSNILVTGNQAVINWTATDTPSGGQIAFLPDSNSATFSSGSDFAILNRVTPGTSGNAIYLGGNISSFAGNFTGGTVYFYSPDGIVIGQNASINVGSLGLTTLPIADDGNGNWITGFGGSNPTVTFGQATNPNSYIRTDAVIDGGINALNEGSYVALVAPRVEHHGRINVNGAAALVGAEAATITFRPSGLFDVQVDVGTTDGNGVSIDGGINGPASGGSGDYHRIYAVAVPKNTALTMLISDGADLGFDVAQAADVVGNAVVLSAGHDIQFGGTSFDPSAASGADANIAVTNSSFTSAVETRSTGFTNVAALFDNSTNFASDLYIRARGDANVTAQAAGASLSVAGNLTMSTDVFGGNDASPVTAANAALYSLGGGTISVAGDVNMSTNASGGDSFVSGSSSGMGTGGNIIIQAETDSSLSIGGSIIASADGSGGQPGVADANAGDGKGGAIFIGTLGNNASVGVTGTTTVHANGYGGSGDGSINECFNCDGLGGTGTGGSISIGTTSGTGSTAYFGDAVGLEAYGEGGRSASAGSAAGTGSGGAISIFSSGGSQVEGFGTTFASDLVASASGQGGESLTSGIAAGLGEGGTVQISAGADSTMGINGDLEVDADGTGGFNDFNVDGGDGLGGQIFVSAQGGNALINVSGTADLEADGDGSFSNGDCIGCGGIGGDGFGGTVQFDTVNGTGNLIAFANSLDLSVQGFGGIGGTGSGGLGRGGTAYISAGTGLSVTVGAGLSIEADGNGGYGYNGNNGGNGTGGTAALYTGGGSISIIGDSFLDASGYGGGTGIVSGGNGGVGDGGVAQYFGTGGSFDIVGSLFLEAVGEGGQALGGIGGNAVGGSALIGTEGAAFHATGNVSLDGGALGGDGNVGGNAAALISPPEDELQPIAAALYVQNNGSIDIDGIAILSAEGVGGQGLNGNGGNGQAGEVDVVAYFGTIDAGSLSIDVNGYGGDGGNGGNGGNGFGGEVDATFGFLDASIGGTITLGSAIITADGEGGDGGDGISGLAGGNGGAGGNGTGGRIGFTGSAAGGTLNSGFATVTVLGTGGNGGAGGTGSTGVGGNGGVGGIGEGGNIQTGTISNEMAVTSGGGANYTTMSLDSSAFGGNGGAGGTGGAGNGIGGDGGNALGGSATFLARGVLVTADTVTIAANATGGDGGSGSALGNGGDARSGAFAVEAKDRFGHADQRGRLEADTITGQAVAQGGVGATNGTGSAVGSSYFRVLNGDAEIGSLSFGISGDIYDPTFDSSYVSVRDGTATITGDFSFTTTGTLVLDASLGSMNAGTINLAAGSFTDAFIIDDVSQPQVGPGTYNASSIDISTGGDFITNAHLVSGGSLDINAPGLIDMRNATSTDGGISLTAGSSINGGNLDAADFVSVLADGNITLGNIDAGSSISAESLGGALAVNDLSAVTSIDLNSPGAILFRDVLAADDFNFEGGSSVTGRDINATTSADGEAEGAIVLRDVTVTGSPNGVDFSVGFTSATSILTGNVNGTDKVGFATFGNLTTGNLSGGSLVMTLVGGNISTGAITTTQPNGQVYMADASMFATGGGGPDSDFDESIVLALDPVATGGSISLNGPVSTGLFRAAAGTNFNSANIDANAIFANAGGTATINGLWSAPDVELWSNDIEIDVEGGIDAGASGNIRLVSTNATQALIGDGLSGSGYGLSNGEFGRLNSGSVEIAARGDASAPIDMLIGDLSITGPSAGSTVDDPNGYVAFATGDLQSETPGGVIRIVGNLTASGFLNTNSLEFYTGRFELDAATGSVTINSSGGALSGELGLYAGQVHVAEGSILDQLAVDPQYSGYQEDLNAPATVQRPDGVLNAATIWIESDNLQDVLIQNTGTAEIPAGFLAQDIFINDEFEVAGPPGSIDLIVNGQLQTEGGLLTGVAVRDAGAEGADLTPFTANSTINGCLLSGACVQTPDNPLPPDFTPTPGIQDVIVLIGDDPAPPPEFGNEDVIDDNDEETEDTSPIIPPQPLFDTSELGEAEAKGNPAFNTTMRSHPGIVQEGDVDDPVSGGGNPALMEEPTANGETQP